MLILKQMLVKRTSDGVVIEGLGFNAILRYGIYIKPSTKTNNKR